jgi:glycosyltransferase involved in cell wall biosynthesis
VLKLFSSIPVEFNASNWYRTIVPFKTAHKMGLANAVIDTHDRIYPHMEALRKHAVLYADVVQHYQSYGQGFEFSAKESGTMPTYWQSKDTWNTPPNFVIDTDDDLFNVMPLNPAFPQLGWQYEGTPIPKGGAVQVELGDGQKMIIAEDGKNGFDVERNVRNLNQFRQNLKSADLVTCSTYRIMNYVMREMGRRNCHVFPNCLDFADYPRVNLAQDDKIRVMWQGSATHAEDLWPFKEAMGRVHKKYPNVEFIIFGQPYGWLMNQLVKERTTHIPWCPYYEYKLRLVTMNHDINLCLLHDCTFNQGRSAIKMYESAVLTKPAASLCEATGAYLDEISDGQTGLLFRGEQEFETKLCQLIEDEKLRRELASNAKDWVRTHRDPKVHVPVLLEEYRRVREARKMIMSPPPPIEEEHVTVPADEPDVRGSEDAGSPAERQTNHN